MKHSIHWSIFGTLIGATVGNACVVERVKAGHCVRQDGDTYCMRRHGDELPYCTRGTCEGGLGDGCVAARPESDACYSPCGGGLSLEEDPECEGLAEGSSSSDSVSATLTDGTTEPTGGSTTQPSGTMTASDTESASSTTASGCVESSECMDAASPICADEACVPCSADEECEAKDPSAPACRDDGQCVACTAGNPSVCGGTTPVCDEGQSACVGCSFHEQCSASACRIATGSCFDAEAVHDVGEGMEFEGIGEAVAMLGEGGEVVLRIFAGASYDEAVTIGGEGTAYALLADDDDAIPQWVNTGGGASTLRVEDGAEVYVQSLRLTLNGAGGFPGITANASSIYLDRTIVVGNTGGGLVLTDGADGHLRNCFVGGNGSAMDIVALEVTSSSADVLYSTLVGYDDGFGDGTALRCTSPTAVSVRNSLVVKTGTGPELDCDDADVTYTATESDTAGDGNVTLGMLGAMWLVNIGNDFHLNNPPADVLTAAQWQVGDPPVDIDGEPRPTEDGAADVAGADVP